MLVYRNMGVLLTMALGCAGDFDSRVASPRSNQDLTAADAQKVSVGAFAQHTLPLLKEMCAGCHGNTQAPLFAVSDAEQAHRAIIEGDKVSFADIPNSRLVLRLTADKHNCADDCQTDGEKFIAAITAWKNEREKSSTEVLAASIVTDSFNPRGTKRLRYDIGKLVSDQYDDETIMLQADIKPLDSGGGYVLSNLQIETSSEPVYVKGIKPVVNGVWNQLNSSLTRVACAAHPPASKLADFADSTIIVEDMKADHQLSFSFAEIRIAAAGDQNCEEDSMTTAEREAFQQKKNEFNQTTRSNVRSYCSCHGPYFEGDTAFKRVWINRENIVRRMTVSNERIMPPPKAAVQLPENIKEEMLEWLSD